MEEHRSAVKEFVQQQLKSHTRDELILILILHLVWVVVAVVIADPRSRNSDRVESRSSHVSRSSDRAVDRDPKASSPVSP